MEEALILNYQRVDIQRGEHLVLRDVDLQVHEGEFVYLTGIVGSGKTSLLKTIYAELDISTGTAEVLGRNMLKLRRREVPALRRELGIVFQDFRLLMDRTVRANLDFVLRATGWRQKLARQTHIQEVMERVGLADILDKMPYELSGGEQQRVGIARAILNAPRLILADEATGNQDAESGRKTAMILHELAESGTAVIMATHNNALIQEFPGTVYECTEQRLMRRSETTTQPQTMAAVAEPERFIPDDIPVATLSTNNE